MIVPLAEEHLDAVAAIEAQDGDVGWSRTHFAKEVESVPVRFFVLLSSDVAHRTSVFAYGGYWKAGPEAQITNLVVARDHRCRGHARELLTFLMNRARAEGCETCTLEVRSGNRHARSLYAKMGFHETGQRPKLYRNPDEDAVMMEKPL